MGKNWRQRYNSSRTLLFSPFVEKEVFLNRVTVESPLSDNNSRMFEWRDTRHKKGCKDEMRSLFSLVLLGEMSAIDATRENEDGDEDDDES